MHSFCSLFGSNLFVFSLILHCCSFIKLPALFLLSLLAILLLLSQIHSHFQSISFFLFISFAPSQSSPLLILLTFSKFIPLPISLVHTSPSLFVVLAPTHLVFYSFPPEFTSPLIFSQCCSLDLSSLLISSSLK